MSKELREALDYIDAAIDIIRRYARERSSEDEIIEEILYHLEEAGELLDTYVSEKGEKTGS